MYYCDAGSAGSASMDTHGQTAADKVKRVNILL